MAPGSPPLARERPILFYGSLNQAGITPACAGKTHLAQYPRFSCRDHPRLRGKDIQGGSKTNLSSGSPPLARERPDVPQVDTAPQGITPACAGKTIAARYEYARRWDHPRLRGKDQNIVMNSSKKWGSPPLARERHGHP